MLCSSSQSLLTSDQKRKFQSLFNTPVDPYWDGKFGFDIIKFDDKVLAQYPESNQNGFSPRDVIVKYYGEEAAVFIEELLDQEPLHPLIKFLTV